MSASEIKVRYSAVLPVAADGDMPHVQCDQRGRILVSPSSSGSSVLPFDSGGVATSLVVKAAPGTLHSIFGFNNAAGVRYIQLFNLVAVPANGQVPHFTPVPVPANAGFSITFSKGWVASAGIVLVSSSTLLTKTLTLAADVWFSGEYE